MTDEPTKAETETPASEGEVTKTDDQPLTARPTRTVPAWSPRSATKTA